MNPLKELMGFVVLTSPLWLLVILLPLALWIGTKAAKKVNRRSARIAVRLLVIALVLLIPFSDEIVGRAYFTHLCKNKVEVNINNAIHLPRHLWDERGQPRFYDEENGNFNLPGYRTEYLKAPYSSLLHIDYFKYGRIEEESGRVLGEVREFMYWGGWIRRNLSPHNTASDCSKRRERSNELIQRMFKPREF